MLLFIGDADAAQSGDEDSFDTSHVTLYLVQPDFYLLVDVFQYISCYSLSRDYNGSGYKRNKFQYISCYSLSLTRPCFFAAFSSFNTSHVTLYLKAVVSSFLWKPCFNTSHVTLYREKGGEIVDLPSVSIHLMLLFILAQISTEAGKIGFQYISCYSLSRVIQRRGTCQFRFNTSHVTLYQKTPYWCRYGGNYVSIHLMLLFIEKELYPYLLYYGFNTSHVTLYLDEHHNSWENNAFQYISCYSLSTGGERWMI